MPWMTPLPVCVHCSSKGLLLGLVTPRLHPGNYNLVYISYAWVPIKAGVRANSVHQGTKFSGVNDSPMLATKVFGFSGRFWELVCLN